MGFVSSLLSILGFGVVGLPLGLLLGFFFFVYSKPQQQVEEPDVTPIQELDTTSVKKLLPEIPQWIKSPDFDRVDWLNTFISDMWPYLDKAICATARKAVKPYFTEYIGKYQVKDIYFESLTLGTLPPTFHGIKVYNTNENELLMEPTIKWAGNPNITLVVTLLAIPIRFQLVDLQVFINPRIRLKPLVSTFPCFSNVMVSLIEKPYVDFGLKILGGDVMSIPGLYRFVQEFIKTQISNLYFWPQFLDIPILDSSIKTKKPMGILHVKIVRAVDLLKMDLLGASDPYVKLKLTGVKLPKKKTTVKMKTLNPEWNENFKFIINDPETQVLQLQVYDWDKVGSHDKLGVQFVPINQLIPHQTTELTLDLLKGTNINDKHSKKPRGKLVVVLTFDPFKYESTSFKERSVQEEKPVGEKLSRLETVSSLVGEAGVLLVTVIGAEDVEGEHHTNPFAQVIFKGERKKTKVIRKNRNPRWNEEFQFMVDEVPLSEKILVELFSRYKVFGFNRKESLGYVNITLSDVVNNGRINEKYHLINSKHGVVQVELEWQTT